MFKVCVYALYICVFWFSVAVQLKTKVFPLADQSLCASVVAPLTFCCAKHYTEGGKKGKRNCDAALMKCAVCCHVGRWPWQ